MDIMQINSEIWGGWEGGGFRMEKKNNKNKIKEKKKKKCRFYFFY